MIVDDILGYVAAAVAAKSVTTDTGSPSQFVEATTSSLENAAAERMFEVELVGLADLNNTGTDAQGAVTEKYVRCRVRIKYFNEFRSRRTFDAIVAQDVQGLQDYVQTYVNQQGGGVGACTTDGESFLEHEAAGNRRVTYSVIPFRIDYRDTLVTS